MSVSDTSLTRTNLGLGATWLTNTNAANFRTAIGLGTAATNATTDFQPASTNLTTLAGNDAANLTNFPALLLRTNGSAAGLTNFPIFNQNTTGTASNVTGVVAITNGGSGATTAEEARTNFGLGATNSVIFKSLGIDNVKITNNTIFGVSTIGVFSGRTINFLNLTINGRFNFMDEIAVPSLLLGGGGSLGPKRLTLNATESFAATNFLFGGVRGTIEVEADNNHAIVATARNTSDGLAFYGYSQSGAPVAKFVQAAGSSVASEPTVVIWRNTEIGQTTPALLINGGSGNTTALTVQAGTNDVMSISFEGLITSGDSPVMRFRGTFTSTNKPASPKAGDMIYRSDATNSQFFQVYNGTNWVP
jgi:hypothetical protein